MYRLRAFNIQKYVQIHATKQNCELAIKEDQFVESYKDVHNKENRIKYNLNFGNKIIYNQ